MGNGYGQYCPLALAAEIFSERWTLLVLSRLLDGCTRFNEIHRGVPRISASLLSQRLKALEQAAIVERRPLPGSRACEYLLTPAGRELEPVLESLAVWGQRWARDMALDDLDVRFLAWSMHTRVDPRAMPAGRTVVELRFSGGPDGGCVFWLVNETDRVEMCLQDPGFEVDLVVSAELVRFVETWRGFRPLADEIARGRIRLAGPAALKQAFPRWLLLSSLARVERQRQGRELATCRRSRHGARATR
ncbi:MAG: helix-turn-helix domain-containing protein [Gammaproteobacteria bacterium]